MTTDRTQPARPPALHDRASAAPADRRDGGAFAALLDAHAPARPAERPAPRADEPQKTQATDPATPDAPPAAAPAEPVAEAKPAAPAAPTPEPTPTPPTVATPGRTSAPRESGPAREALLDEFAAHIAVNSSETRPGPSGPVVAPAPNASLDAPVTAAPAAEPAAAAKAASTVGPAPKGAPVAAPAPSDAPAAEPAPDGAVPIKAPVRPDRAVPAGPVAAAPNAPAPANTPAPNAPAPAATPAAPPSGMVAAGANTPASGMLAAAPEPAATPADAGLTASQPLRGDQPLAGHVAPHRAAPLHRAPAAVATLLHVAAERGISHAKMALRPAELGGIEIRLQASAAGVAAQVVADSPEAAKLLAQAQDDLRRALEARDVTLLSLDVSTSADQQRQDSARGELSGDRDAERFGARPATGAARDAAGPAPTPTVIELPGGLLVDVLA